MTSRPPSDDAGQGPSQRRGTPAESQRHIPVLLSEVLQTLAPKAGEIYLDGTFGAGGYTRAILDAADCRVIAVDRDPTAIAAGQVLVEAFEPRLALLPGRFGDLDALAAEAGHPLLDGVVLDIGVSSMQLHKAERGFSFMSDGPLDMRMGRDGESAADVVNTADEALLADILFHLGEERRARQIARAIVHDRATAPFARTRQLADLISRLLGGRRGDPIHPATRAFQALRIYVNDELGELARGLAAAERCLKPGGRLVVVTFHSLEDRIVKRFLAERAGKQAQGSRHLPQRSIELKQPSFRLVNPKPLTPQKGEQDANPRARSARLRAAERTEAPAWPLDEDAVGVPLSRT
jgi:16S rRNA (cytosine1402-N4)-methyltransferase